MNKKINLKKNGWNKYKYKKGKNDKSGKQNKQKPKETLGCLSFGKLDLIYKIDFTEKDLEKPEEEVQNY